MLEGDSTWLSSVSLVAREYPKVKVCALQSYKHVLVEEKALDGSSSRRLRRRRRRRAGWLWRLWRRLLPCWVWRPGWLFSLSASSNHSACNRASVSQPTLKFDLRAADQEDQEHHHGLLLLRPRQPGKCQDGAQVGTSWGSHQATTIIGFVMRLTATASIMHSSLNHYNENIEQPSRQKIDKRHH